MAMASSPVEITSPQLQGKARFISHELALAEKSWGATDYPKCWYFLEETNGDKGTQVPIFFKKLLHVFWETMCAQFDG